MADGNEIKGKYHIYPEQVVPDILARYAGAYDLGGRIIKFKTSTEGLLVKIFGDNYFNVLFTSENEFFIWFKIVCETIT